jgi:ubiquinone/menaquinone biosynthesis C-methylase UbiE
MNGDPQTLGSNQVFHGFFQNDAERMQCLYGLAWSQLSRDQYFDAARLFADRMRNSNFDLSFLRGAECLDLGTGIARYALAMIQLGAQHVVGIDFSLECIEEAKRRLKGSEEGKLITLIHGDLYELSRDRDQAFDFVCANGVIHHLPDPVKGLQVVFRCLRKSGKAFAFVFSRSDGPWWRSIELIRKLTAPVPLQYAHKIVTFYEVQGTKIFNMLDYCYTPIQHKFDRKWFEETLSDVGFRDIRFLEGGVIHDSVLRCRLFETDRELYGITEIRYLLGR